MFREYLALGMAIVFLHLAIISVRVKKLENQTLARRSEQSLGSTT